MTNLNLVEQVSLQAALLKRTFFENYAFIDGLFKGDTQVAKRVLRKVYRAYLEAERAYSEIVVLPYKIGPLTQKETLTTIAYLFLYSRYGQDSGKAYQCVLDNNGGVEECL